MDLEAIDSEAQLDSPYLGRLFSDASPEAEPSRLLKSAMLWHCWLGHIGLPLLKKTAKITTGLPKFDLISDRDFFCAKCAMSKAVRRIVTPPVADLAVALAVIVGDLVTIKPSLHS